MGYLSLCLSIFIGEIMVIKTLLIVFSEGDLYIMILFLLGSLDVLCSASTRCLNAFFSCISDIYQASLLLCLYYFKLNHVGNDECKVKLPAFSVVTSKSVPHELVKFMFLQSNRQLMYSHHLRKRFVSMKLTAACSGILRCAKHQLRCKAKKYGIQFLSLNVCSRKC